MLHHRIVSTSLLATSLLSSFMVLPSTGLAQPYPSQMIRLVVPSAAGTPPDIISRIVANELTQTEGWRVVVENKPGGMQTIGGIEVLKQPADGYTVMSAALAAAVAPALMSNVIFRLDGDFAPVIKLAAAHHILVVHPSVPANSLPEFVGLLKSQPDKLTFSSGGFGTPAHMAGELFKLQTGVRATHVPYSALPRAIGDLLSGTNQYQFITPLAVLDLIATGKLRALAVTSATRLAVLSRRTDGRRRRLWGTDHSGLVRSVGEERNTQRDHHHAKHMPSTACSRNPTCVTRSRSWAQSLPVAAPWNLGNSSALR